FNHSITFMHIAKSMKVIEWLKTEILDQIANLYKGLQTANQSLIADSLASLVVPTYVLARRVGLSFRDVDEAVPRKPGEAAQERHQLEDWYGDLSQLEEYINKR